MIRLGTAYDIYEMKQLWDASFDDTVNYIDFIFDKVSSPKDAMINEQDGHVAAMLLMIPTKFIYLGNAVNALYILGAATASKYQNRGYMTELLKQAENRARNSGANLSVLVPGERYLFDYYKRRGYSADFSLRSVNLKAGMLPDLQSEGTVEYDRIDSETLFRIRESVLASTPHISWGEKQIPFVIEDSIIYGDHVADYKGVYGRSYAFFGMDHRKLYIKECLGTTKEAQYALIRALLKRQNPKGVNINLPVSSDLFEGEGTVVPYGMAKPLNSGASIHDFDSYMNLMLD